MVGELLPGPGRQKVRHPRGVDDLLVQHPGARRAREGASFIAADQAAAAKLGGGRKVVHVAMAECRLRRLQVVDGLTGPAVSLGHGRLDEQRQGVGPCRPLVAQAARVAFGASQRVSVRPMARAMRAR